MSALELPLELYYKMLQLLPKEPLNGCEYWVAGDTIICASEKSCNALADVFDALDNYGCNACTGYFDRIEDERNGEVDRCTGYWYVDIA